MNTALDHNRITIDVHLTDTHSETLDEEIRSGLLASPRSLPTKYFYDDYGSELFERICELPEYYQTRTEHALLATYADDIIHITGADELVELGSGASTKTRVLLDAMAHVNQLQFYVPFDVSEGIVRRVAQELAAEYSCLRIHGVIGDFLAHMEHIPNGGKRLVAFLGGTLGNLKPDTAEAFLASVYNEMNSGDYFLLGIQLITDIERLEAAYNDVSGLSAQFNKNILPVVHNLTGANFDPNAFEHVAIYNQPDHRIEMWLRSLCNQTITFPRLAWHLPLKAGESILTEISTKYNRQLAENVLTTAGFTLREWHTDSQELLGLALAYKP
ncbi:MAG: L-histidine N(alpha)-methyltransferase [Nitrospirales bacterium]|nr:L-histidine N(alpha)-methyltransferase [Nitrospirales bacterium]